MKLLSFSLLFTTIFTQTDRLNVPNMGSASTVVSLSYQQLVNEIQSAQNKSFYLLNYEIEVVNGDNLYKMLFLVEGGNENKYIGALVNTALLDKSNGIKSYIYSDNLSSVLSLLDMDLDQLDPNLSFYNYASEFLRNSNNFCSTQQQPANVSRTNVTRTTLPNNTQRPQAPVIKTTRFPVTFNNPNRRFVNNFQNPNIPRSQNLSNLNNTLLTPNGNRIIFNSAAPLSNNFPSTTTTLRPNQPTTVPGRTKPLQIRTNFTPTSTRFLNQPNIDPSSFESTRLTTQPIKIVPNPKNTRDFLTGEIQSTPKSSIAINCNALRFPTNPTESFYKNLVENQQKHGTVFTKDDEREFLLKQLYLDCFRKRFNIPEDNTPSDIDNKNLVNILSRVNTDINNLKNIQFADPTTNIDIQEPVTTTDKNSTDSTITNVTTTTTTTDTTGDTFILGDFSLSEFDNILNMLEESPEALSQLNLKAFQEGEDQNSPLSNADANLTNFQLTGGANETVTGTDGRTITTITRSTNNQETSSTNLSGGQGTGLGSGSGNNSGLNSSNSNFNTTRVTRVITDDNTNNSIRNSVDNINRAITNNDNNLLNSEFNRLNNFAN